MALTDFRYDYALGGTPWLSAASRERPILRDTAEIRKQQFDTSNIPGENGLEGWWIRSQQSFHGGMGQKYNDPSGYTGYNIDAASLTKFLDSRNIDVWTQGEIKLLHDVDRVNATVVGSDSSAFWYLDGTAAVLSCISGGLNWVTEAGTTGTVMLATGTYGIIRSLTTDGTTVYAGTDNGIWSAPIPATSADPWVFTKQYNATSGVARVTFIKQRLMFGNQNMVYELDPHPASIPATLPAAKYTASDSALRWVDFVETPTSIIAFGKSGVRGAAVQFTLAYDGTIPTLTGGATAAELPRGELPYCAVSYLGTYIGIGTNKGIRIGILDGNGQLTYGPLLCNTTYPVACVTARDRFLYFGVRAGIGGNSGLYRVDLSTAANDLRFPYATDLVVNSSNAVNWAAPLGNDRVAFGVGGGGTGGTYVESATDYAATGWLTTSRVRMGTLEPKHFKKLRVRGPVLTGGLTATLIDDTDVDAQTVTYTDGQNPGAEDRPLTVAGAQDFMSLRLTLTRQSSTVTPVVTGYQLKAMPGVQRQRQIQLPLLCFDFERDSAGRRHGRQGDALDRLAELENLERSGDSITWVDNTAGGVSREVVIDKLRFEQTAPPSQAEGFGGVVSVVLRTI